MSQQVQELIDKIKSEGIQAAEKKAGEIESQAKDKADRIINDAKKQGEQFIASAQADIKKMKESTIVALQQASRDTLLNLRKEIQGILHNILTAQVRETMTPEQLSQILEAVIKNYLSHSTAKAEIAVTLSHHDLKILRDGFIKKLQDHLKHPIKFHASAEISKGFTISFDSGKSSFDFTDESLVEYLANYLNPDVSDIVKKSLT